MPVADDSGGASFSKMECENKFHFSVNIATADGTSGSDSSMVSGAVRGK